MTGLKASTVQKKFQSNMEKTMNLAGSIPARTVKGKDIRTNKQKMEDGHLIKFQVTKKNNFDAALDQNLKEQELIGSLQ